LLLIDEINLSEGVDEGTSPQKVAAFLKEHFLAKRGRYFVFTSCALSIDNAQYLNSPNEQKGLMLRQLPLIPSVHKAIEHLNRPDLRIQEEKLCIAV
jgi:hypothetical protein